MTIRAIEFATEFSIATMAVVPPQHYGGRATSHYLVILQDIKKKKPNIDYGKITTNPSIQTPAVSKIS